MSDIKATLTIEGKDPIDLNVYKGTVGPDVVDVTRRVGQPMA